MIQLPKDDFTRSILYFGRPKPTPIESTHVVACSRRSVKKLGSTVPQKFIEWLEQNQKIKSCCRHPENHDFIVFKSKLDEPVPDVYVFICPENHLLGHTEDGEEVWGEAHHTRFMVGSGERPSWDVR